MDGDHFIVKNNTDQIYELGNKQDIEGFKNFVTQPSTSVNALDMSIQEEMNLGINKYKGVPDIPRTSTDCQ